MPLDRLVVPTRVDLQPEELSFSIEFGKWRHIRPPANLLERFLKARSDAALFRFAQSFGPLTTPNWLKVWDTGFRESLPFWRRFQWELDYLLGIAATLREGLDINGDPRDAYEQHGIQLEPYVSFLSLADLGRGEKPTWNEHAKSRRQAMASRVFLWRVGVLTQSCELRPTLIETVSGERRFDLVFQTGSSGFGMSLRGALSAQFLAAATGSGFAVCSACGRCFVPQRRRPAFGKRRFCHECGRAAALRAAKASWRDRERLRQAKSERTSVK
jgi:hypothetical protein